MDSDRPSIPIQNSIRSHPKRVWMGSREAVTILLNSNVPQKILFGWTSRVVFIGYPAFVDGSA